LVASLKTEVVGHFAGEELLMNRRAAVTLVELLVVLAIIAVVLGLLLPAVQNVREAARRIACANNLRQIGLACHSYHDAGGAFPPGYSAYRCADPLETHPGWGWAARLLPFLEQDALQHGIVFHASIAKPINEAARCTLLRAYLCPSDPDVPDDFPVTDLSGRLVARVAPTSYAANYGSGELDEIPGPREGVFYRNSRVRLADISDGSSSTIMIGDRAWSHAMAPWAGAVPHGVVRGGPLNPWRDNPEAAYPAPNFCLVQTNKIGDAHDADGSLDEFYSEHPGGVNVLFADGSIHFLRNSINHAVLQALGTRAGGEVVSETDY
jgi:prepilin-type processing-associated H-X9-DG protein/prepilin-type N-terminal cleavage/methylation domain-containing protein